MTDQKRLFLDPNVKPEDILEEALGKHYAIYCQFMEKLHQLECVLEWYYLCGAWYFDVMSKEKTIGQLFVFNIGLQLWFVFGEKARHDIVKLDISNHLKKKAASTAGRRDILLMAIDLKDSKGLDDAVEILKYAITSGR